MRTRELETARSRAPFSSTPERAFKFARAHRDDWGQVSGKRSNCQTRKLETRTGGQFVDADQKEQLISSRVAIFASKSKNIDFRRIF